jgi:hypothetical protein
VSLAHAAKKFSWVDAAEAFEAEHRARPPRECAMIEDLLVKLDQGFTSIIDLVAIVGLQRIKTGYEVARIAEVRGEAIVTFGVSKR